MVGLPPRFTKRQKQEAIEVFNEATRKEIASAVIRGLIRKAIVGIIDEIPDDKSCAATDYSSECRRILYPECGKHMHLTDVGSLFGVHARRRLVHEQ